MELKLRPKEECTFDAVSLGEVMLRLDPGEGRIRTARSFRAWEGGGEYNVIRGLHKCFGFKTAVLTAFADNEVGLLSGTYYNNSEFVKLMMDIAADPDANWLGRTPAVKVISKIGTKADLEKLKATISANSNDKDGKKVLDAIEKELK